MKITMLTIGTQGAVGPLVCFGIGLKEAGHSVTVATHENFRTFVTRRGIGFAAIAGDANNMLKSSTVDREFRSGGNPLTYFLALRQEARDLSKEAVRVLDRCVDVCRGADALVYHDHMYAADSIAEYYGVPGIQAYNTPVTPTSEFPSYVGFQPWAKASLYNLSTHYLRDYVTWLPFRSILNAWRRSTLGLRPISFSGPHRYLHRKRVLLLYSISPTILPKPRDWGRWVHVTGYWHRSEHSTWQPPVDLEDFLEAGPKPICIGFGSMKYGDPARLTGQVISALRMTKQRAILLTGWGGLSGSYADRDVYVCKEVPHDWLYARTAAAVHAGGAGTLTASLRAGLPTLTVPFGGDNIFWSWRCTQLGAGPQPIPVYKLNAENLAAGIRAITSDPRFRNRAEEVGSKIQPEDGVGTAVEVFHESLRI